MVAILIIGSSFPVSSPDPVAGASVTLPGRREATQGGFACRIA